jgi:hypothetical protein
MILLLLSLLLLAASSPLHQALDGIEEALDSIEEIQWAQTLEEAHSLAWDAQQLLEDATRELEEAIKLSNSFWLGDQGALYWHGPILDKETKEPVEAFVFINGRLVTSGVTKVEVLMWNTQESPITVHIRAEGYKPWELVFRFRLKGLEVLKGPVWLEKE